MSPRVESTITWAFITVVLVVAVAVMGTNLEHDADRVVCLRAGYPAVQVADGNSFCVKRVGGTDQVVAVSQVKAAP